MAIGWHFVLIYSKNNFDHFLDVLVRCRNGSTIKNRPLTDYDTIQSMKHNNWINATVVDVYTSPVQYRI